MSFAAAASRLTLAAILSSLMACASAAPEWEGPTPADTYASALGALEEGDHTRGRAELAAVLDRCGTTALGEKAAVALMVDALTPQQPDADYSARISHAYLSQPYRTAWGERVATAVYLVSLNLGADADADDVLLESDDPDRFPSDCRDGSPEPTRRGPAEIPTLEVQSLVQRLAELERSSAELQAELDRVRETLRP